MNAYSEQKKEAPRDEHDQQLRRRKLIPGPSCVKNILISEVCERFSYYGLRAILTIYCTDELGWSESEAVSFFFYTSALAYFMPLLGGYVSDTWLGKYLTILSFSLIYVLGSFVLAMAAVPSSAPGTIVGLVLIGVGTGGIKPNVSSFGAEQFNQQDLNAIGYYFRVFYFCINIGSVVSFIVSPFLRSEFGYGIAFGVPCVLLALATVVFWSARRQYIIRRPDGSIFTSLVHTLRCAWRARRVHTSVVHSSSSSIPPFAAATNYATDHEGLNPTLGSTVDGDANTRPSHWVEKARGARGITEHRIQEVVSVCRLTAVMACLPTFWMLFDQQGSAWTLQATKMNTHGILPEHMGVLNPLC